MLKSKYRILLNYLKLTSLYLATLALASTGCASGDDFVDAAVSASAEATSASDNAPVDAPSDAMNPVDKSAEDLSVIDMTDYLADEEPEDENAGKLLGNFQFTYYWMAQEKRSKSAKKTPIYNSRCKPIAKVTQSYARRLAMEGTGTLRDGRLVNVSGPCECDRSPCFFVIKQKEKRWGVGVAERPLSPFRSAAVDTKVVKIGTTLYVPELDGLLMPGVAPWGGFVHDGCLIADDRGGGVKGKQIDFFMARRPYYEPGFLIHQLSWVTGLLPWLR